MLDIEKSQAEIKKIKAYITKYDPPHNYHFDASMKDLLALVHGVDRIEGILIAFQYGKAKAWQQAKKELQRKIA